MSKCKKYSVDIKNRVKIKLPIKLGQNGSGSYQKEFM